MQLVPRPQRRAASLIAQIADQAVPAQRSQTCADTIRESTSDRVAIFIDGSNLFYAAMQLGLEVDYSKLLGYLVDGRRLLRAYFYTGVDPHNEKQQGFLLWMRRHGYRVITKELAQNPDGTKHANLDVEIAVDMLQLAPYCNTIVLLSGDGDLTYALNTVAYRGVQVEVVSLQTMTSDSLVNIADRYVDLARIRNVIQRNDVESRTPAMP